MEIDEKRLKDILTEQREEFQRVVEEQRRENQHFFGIMKEDFDSKIELIAEQYSDIKKTLSSHGETLASHSEMFASHSEMLASHGEMLTSHGEMLASHGEMLASHTEMLGAIMEDLSIVKTDIQIMKGSLKQKVDYEEFQALEKRVAMLETKSRK